jgi:hypothetical protein
MVKRLLDQVTPHFVNTDCTLMGDRGLVGWPLVQLCREQHWHYLLRVRKEHTCRRWMGRWTAWRPLGQVITKPGKPRCGRVQLWREPPLETHLSAVWDPAYQDVWFLISDRPAGRERIGECARRARVEATFQDSKSRGWHLEASRIADRTRLDRLLLALFLAWWWVAHLAAACMHHGHRPGFDRPDRRDKGILRLGRLWLLEILRRARDVAVLLRCLPFHRQGTSLSLC